MNSRKSRKTRSPFSNRETSDWYQRPTETGTFQYHSVYIRPVNTRQQLEQLLEGKRRREQSQKDQEQIEERAKQGLHEQKQKFIDQQIPEEIPKHDKQTLQENLRSDKLQHEKRQLQTVRLDDHSLSTMSSQANQRSQTPGETRPQWTSQLYSHMVKNPCQASPQDLDHEVAMYERRHTQDLEKQRANYVHMETNKAREIHDLKSDLNATKEKLKILQESKFKSQERELGVDDSKLTLSYKQLVQDIRDLVRHLMRAQGVRIILKQQDFIVELKDVLAPTMTIPEFILFLNTSNTGERSDSIMIGFILRAVILNMLRKSLFNHNVFKGFGLIGEAWGSLPRTYQNLMPRSDEITRNLTDDENKPIPPGDQRHKQDASLWRSQTLVAIDKHVQRLGIEPQQQEYLELLTQNIKRVLESLTLLHSGLTEEELHVDVANLVQEAASLAKIFGKQRAMFEIENKRYLGNVFSKNRMSAVGPGHELLEADENGVPPKPNQMFDVVAVVVPALYKFGNDDGINFEDAEVKHLAEVLIVDSGRLRHIKEKAKAESAASASSQEQLPIHESIETASQNIQSGQTLQTGKLPQISTESAPNPDRLLQIQKDPGQVQVDDTPTQLPPRTFDSRSYFQQSQADVDFPDGTTSKHYDIADVSMSTDDKYMLEQHKILASEKPSNDAPLENSKPHGNSPYHVLGRKLHKNKDRQRSNVVVGSVLAATRNGAQIV